MDPLALRAIRQLTYARSRSGRATSVPDSSQSATAKYSMPGLTQAVVNGGIVTGYWDLGSGADDNWWQLPDVFQFFDGNVSTVNFVYSAGEVGLQVTGPTSASVRATVAAIDGHRLRVVVIPPA